jgi:small conductance mechanosensitive channel
MTLAMPMPHVLPTPEVLGEMGVRVAFIALAALVTQRLLFLIWTRLPPLLARTAHDREAALRRGHTLREMLRHLTTVVVSMVAVFYILGVLGWDVKPLLAGAGVVGVAIGFGAQTLVRDWIAGVSILAENQFGVGDIVEINGRPGTVESLTVRRTLLRDFNGYLHFVPNGEMKIVTNRSRDWNRLAVDVPVSTGQNLERALECCRAVAESMSADPTWQPRLLEPIPVWGIERLGADAAVIRLVVRTRPGNDAPEAARELRRLIHDALAAAGIEYPSSSAVVAGPDAGLPT